MNVFKPLDFYAQCIFYFVQAKVLKLTKALEER